MLIRGGGNTVTGAIAGGSVGGPAGVIVGAIIGGAAGYYGGKGAVAVLSKITERSDRIQKARERKHYSSFCKNPPPKTGDHCVDLENRYLHAKQCLALREEFGNRWYNDNGHGHATENSNWSTRIENLESQLRDQCPDACSRLGLN